MNYSDYLNLPQLLSLQHPRSDPAEHDETLFIIIHQTYELWFKLMLHELEKIRGTLSAGDLYTSIAGFQRIRTVMKTLVAQLDILETMTPMSFASFRDRLDTSSGFQSYQFREIEFILGYKRPEILGSFFKPGNPGYGAIERRVRERSIVDAMYDLLERQGVAIPAQVRQRDIKLPALPSSQIQDALLNFYKTRPDLAILFELMTDFDEGMQEWRYRHVKIVERTIGAKRGTGGSPGVEFLKQSLFHPVFADLWAIRHRI
jgi:tryptophan 2,3-dioxygenase